MKEQILRWCYRRRWFLLIILIILALEKGFLTQSSVANMNASDIIVLNDKWEKEWTEDHKILEYHYQIPSDVEDSLKLSVKTYVSEFSIYLDNRLSAIIPINLAQMAAESIWFSFPRMPQEKC